MNKYHYVLFVEATRGFSTVWDDIMNALPGDHRSTYDPYYYMVMEHRTVAILK